MASPESETDQSRASEQSASPHWGESVTAAFEAAQQESAEDRVLLNAPDIQEDVLEPAYFDPQSQVFLDPEEHAEAQQETAAGGNLAMQGLAEALEGIDRDAGVDGREAVRRIEPSPRRAGETGCSNRHQDDQELVPDYSAELPRASRGSQDEMQVDQQGQVLHAAMQQDIMVQMTTMMRDLLANQLAPAIQGLASAQQVGLEKFHRLMCVRTMNHDARHESAEAAARELKGGTEIKPPPLPAEVSSASSAVGSVLQLAELLLAECESASIGDGSSDKKASLKKIEGGEREGQPSGGKADGKGKDQSKGKAGGGKFLKQTWRRKRVSLVLGLVVGVNLNLLNQITHQVEARRLAETTVGMPCQKVLGQVVSVIQEGGVVTGHRTVDAHNVSSDRFKYSCVRGCAGANKIGDRGPRLVEMMLVMAVVTVTMLKNLKSYLQVPCCDGARKALQYLQGE
ncbi:unnamed protein product [Symbiodinium microadriaticum]|nr:unnamed protein product [Symbiodinium microadriaticum]